MWLRSLKSLANEPRDNFISEMSTALSVLHHVLEAREMFSRNAPYQACTCFRTNDKQRGTVCSIFYEFDAITAQMKRRLHLHLMKHGLLVRGGAGSVLPDYEW